MAFVKRVRPDRAKGVLKREYGAALKRAGKIFHIVDVQSLAPEALRDGMRLYQSIMLGQSELTRAQRELIAGVVSAANGCHYWVEAHFEDFRVESKKDALAAAVKDDYRKAKLTRADRALCDFAVKLTVEPWSMSAADGDALRAAGFSDAAIVAAVEVVGYFNYINRVADGLGVDLEPEMPPGHPKPKYRGG